MKHNSLVIALITALSIGIFSSLANAMTNKNNIKESRVERFLNGNKDGADLLRILSEINNDIENNEIQKAQSRSTEINEFLQRNQKEFSRHSHADEEYYGDRVLEIRYDNWHSYKILALPITMEKHKTSDFNFLKKEPTISRFKKNEINGAKIKYVSYSFDNDVESELQDLLHSLAKGETREILEDIEEVYDDLFVDHSDRISLVKRIRENLAVARFLMENQQFKAAENSVGMLDSLMLKLAKAKSDSPEEERKIRELERELNDVSKLSDKNYISKWEKIPQEIEDWWVKE